MLSHIDKIMGKEEWKEIVIQSLIICPMFMAINDKQKQTLRA